jgi:epoxyqueuosine reductase
MQHKEAIQNEAHRLGFSLVGVTTPHPPSHVAAFESWLRAGNHGEMAYLASERSLARRTDPRLILPECKSILALATLYYPPVPQTDQSGRGKVAAYAWGYDYHEVLTQRMQALVAFIELQVGQSVPNRCYTDTGPLLERDLAQRAGLGWIGKNTCLINPRLGSYFFLAEVLLGVELEPDQPFLPDRCGSCRRCIEACPTGCIHPNRTLDARRCISYLTIELKGVIPKDLRPQMGDWVFGCDICQQVCPWNRFAPHTSDQAFAPRPEVAAPELAADLHMTAEQFNRKFERSPMKRAKRSGYLRNLAIVAGNTGAASAVAALIGSLVEDADPLIRAHAAWALGKIGSEESRRALDLALRTEKDLQALAEIQDALKIG